MAAFSFLMGGMEWNILKGWVQKKYESEEKKNKNCCLPQEVNEMSFKTIRKGIGFFSSVFLSTAKVAFFLIFTTVIFVMDLVSKYYKQIGLELRMCLIF